MSLNIRVFAAAALACSAQHNPPVWPNTVRVFGPDDGDIQAAVNAAYQNNGGPNDHGQFSNDRYAFLFKPGVYDIDVPVGYYTQVAGLGQKPTDVQFTSAKGVYCEEGTASVTVGSLNTFWRAAENFHTAASYKWFGNFDGMLWAASQAASVRRVLVDNQLILFRYRDGEILADYASGGYLANSWVKGIVTSGSQQQYFLRNNEIQWSGGVWNMVFVGTEGAPASHCGHDKSGGLPIVNVGQTPTVAEKPFISIESSGRYFLNVPALRTDSRGVDWSVGTQISFEHVYVADASKDTSATINAQLGAGMHVVLAPGIYNLDTALELSSANQVLLGLGLATLVAAQGEPAVQVGNVDGVRIAGILLEAGTQASDALLVWGNGSYAGSASNPGLLADVFTRAGGPQCQGRQTKTFMKINSGNVIGDNMWLWRADHCTNDVSVPSLANPVNNGLVVNGDDVTMYGLAVEHTLKDLTQWNGDRGATYFYQSELPYDVDQSWGDKGYVGFRVAEGVSAHRGYGVGVYHYFRDHAVVVDTGISVPSHLESGFVSPLVVFLNGQGTLKHILNDKGESTSKTDGANAVPAWYCGGGPSPPAPPTPPTPPGPPTPKCNVGDKVLCPDHQTYCAGNQCCPGGITCPSADPSFHACPKGKTEDCTGQGFSLVV